MPQFNISALVAEWGARYTNEGQTMKDIKAQLFAPSETELFFSKRPTEGDYFKSAYATIDSVTQGFSIPFLPKSAGAYLPWETRLGEFKVDDLFTPDQHRASWAGFLANIQEVDRSKWPVIKWWIQEMLIPKTHEEMEEDIAYYGWQKTADGTAAIDGTTLVRVIAPNTTTKANTAMNGLKHTFVRMVAAGRCNVINTGALAAGDVDFVTQVENFVQDIDPALRKKCDFLFMSTANKNKYRRGRRAKYNTNYLQEADLLEVDNSNIKVQDLHSMGNSDKIWTTPERNRIMPIHKDNTGVFDVQKADRSVKILNDWKKVITFDVPEFVVTNDRDNTFTAGNITALYS
ncbi:MAG: hypothetical protein H0X62_04135 [Bacteroidetes bacterium]|nr:hypothetical protein [Bacteroidota bacterium]